jgi:hypothetical protein
LAILEIFARNDHYFNAIGMLRLELSSLITGQRERTNHTQKQKSLPQCKV